MIERSHRNLLAGVAELMFVEASDVVEIVNENYDRCFVLEVGEGGMRSTSVLMLSIMNVDATEFRGN